MKFLATMKKEALVLCRDRAGLAILFIMPAVMVVVVTLVQEDAYRIVGGAALKLLFVDEDGGAFSRDLEKHLGGADSFEIVKTLDGVALTEASARSAVSRGEYQACVVVREGASRTGRKRADDLVDQAMLDTGEGSASGDEAPTEAVVVYFDRASTDVYRRAVTNALQRIVQALEMKMIIDAVGEMVGDGDERESEGRIAWEPGDLLNIREVFAGEFATTIIPTSVQQNVPAWTLFAMFMIVVPLSGTIIQERDGGTLVRLRTLPVSYWTVLGGKVAVYGALCVCQFGLMLLIGAFIMPRLGTPALAIGSNYGALLVAVVASALAATGLGIMVGTLARTHGQATVFGVMFVVVAGVLGGVMVPVFMMPLSIRGITVFSPMNWGLNAFLDVFLRGGGLGTIAPHVLRLLLFFACTMTVAVMWFRRRA